MKGLFHIYTGEGKGKTTAGVGLVIRAHGQGLKCLYCQFLKSGSSGERNVLEQLGEGIAVYEGVPIRGFLWEMDEEKKKKVYEQERELWKRVKAQIETGNYEMAVLDEMMTVVELGIVGEEEVLETVSARPEQLELVFTGRGNSDKLLEAADYVTEMKKIKHPYEQGVRARKGVEF